MDDNRTVWCGNLSEKVTEEVLYELFLQAGPLERVKIPKDSRGRQRTFGFITFKHACSVPYSLALFEGTSLFNKALLLQSRSTNIDIPQGQAGINNIQNIGRHRTQSVPINFGSATAAVSDYNMLLQLGQQMLIPGSFGSEQFQLNQYQTSTPSNSLPLYGSQMNSSYYLGGDPEKISKTNQNNYGNNRHHPYSSSGSRSHENIHNSDSHHSSSKSGRHRHDRRHSGGRRHH